MDDEGAMTYIIIIIKYCMYISSSSSSLLVLCGFVCLVLAEKIKNTRNEKQKARAYNQSTNTEF